MNGALALLAATLSFSAAGAVLIGTAQAATIDEDGFTMSSADGDFDFGG